MAVVLSLMMLLTPMLGIAQDVVPENTVVAEKSTEAPTAEPAPEATEEPTAEPTSEATEEPTAEPTQEATEEPTAEPTPEATEEPTAEPTPEATEEPTAEPTQEATEEPTAALTPEATEEPTTALTPEATEEPTAEPIQEATEEPTAEPTPQATEEPTAEPTQEATEKPTEEAPTVDYTKTIDENPLFKEGYAVVSAKTALYSSTDMDQIVATMEKGFVCYVDSVKKDKAVVYFAQDGKAASGIIPTDKLMPIDADAIQAFVEKAKDEVYYKNNKNLPLSQLPEDWFVPIIEPTSEPTPEVTEEPTAEPTIEAMLEATEEPTTEPTVEPTSSPNTIGGNVILAGGNKPLVSLSQPLTINSFKPSANTVGVGNKVTWTVNATGGKGPYQYKYHVYRVGHTGAYYKSEWRASPTFSYTFQNAAIYSVDVIVMDATGDITPFVKSTQVKITNGVPSITSFTPSTTSTPFGNTVKWTTKVTGGTAPYQYKFHVYRVGHEGAYYKSEWRSSSTFTYTFQNPAVYTVDAIVMDADGQQTAMKKSVSVAITAPAPQISSITPSTTKIDTGNAVKWTVNINNGVKPLQFRYIIYRQGVASAYYTSTWRTVNTFSFTFANPGTYTVDVYARDGIGQVSNFMKSTQLVVNAGLTLPSNATINNANVAARTLNGWPSTMNGATYKNLLACSNADNSPEQMFMFEKVGNTANQFKIRLMQYGGPYIAATTSGARMVSSAEASIFVITKSGSNYMLANTAGTHALCLGGSISSSYPHYAVYMAAKNTADLNQYWQINSKAASIQLNSCTISLGQTRTITGYIVGYATSTPPISYTSSNTAVATITSGGQLTAVGAGTTVITGRTPNGLSATCTVTVSSTQMSQADRLVAVALAEAQANHLATNEYGYKYSATMNGAKYNQYGTSVAWCAAFVGWCAKEAGINAVIPRHNTVSDMYSLVINAGGYEVGSPTKGDLVFYKTNYGTWCHVAVMVDSKYTVQGNVGSRLYFNLPYYNYSAVDQSCNPVFVRPGYTN